MELSNKNGMHVSVLPIGASIQKILLPDGSDVTLGYDKAADYEADSVYFGCVVGRVANRISKCEFTLDGKAFKLAENRPAVCLHGGVRGFNKALWTTVSSSSSSVKLHHLSKDGDENFPGNLNVNVQYTLTDDNELKIDYEATTDKPTIVNLTQHAYFNLAGHNSGTVGSHVFQVFDANGYLVKGKDCCPTGEILPLVGTPLAGFGSDSGASFEKCFNIPFVEADNGGLDVSFELKSGKAATPHKAARVTDPVSGRWMEISTTEPIAHLYTGNYLNGVAGKGGAVYNKYGAFCVETQVHPDACNKSGFPSIVLRPGEVYRQQTVWKFGGF